jgi:lipid-binding SYLF domain-containing protein
MTVWLTTAAARANTWATTGTPAHNLACPRANGRTVAYYHIAAASLGLQAGVQTFSYALLFMNEAALNYLSRSNGWSVGSGPSVVVVNRGVAAA